MSPSTSPAESYRISICMVSDLVALPEGLACNEDANRTCLSIPGTASFRARFDHLLLFRSSCRRLSHLARVRSPYDRTNTPQLDLCRPVEADYTVIFFAAGARHHPGWNWVWKAYRSLNRKYRKNLKKLVSFCILCPLYLPCSFLVTSVA